MKTVTKTSTLKRVISDKSKELRIGGTVVVTNPGKPNERRVLETTEWDGKKEIVTKVPLPNPQK
jgi:hypothetical protein